MTDNKVTENKKLMLKASIIMLLLMYSIIGAYWVYYSSSQYRNAIFYIHQGDWLEASIILRRIPNYKNVNEIYNYVLANLELEQKSKEELELENYKSVIKYLNQIPDDYHGDFQRPIQELKEKIQNMTKPAI